MNVKQMADRAVGKVLGSLGYELRKKDSLRGKVIFGNFDNLAKAYEILFFKGEQHSSTNEKRTPLLARLLGTPPAQAYYIIDAIGKCKKLSGDICEFGVAQGETSALIANEIQEESNKCLHLFDSFEGLPKPTDKDHLKDDIFSLGSMDAYTGTMSCPEDMVRSRMKAVNFPESRYCIHKGFIERVIGTDKNMPTLVSFAYVDFDFYEPIQVALNYLDKVTQSGSIIMVDDYDFFSTGAKTAVDEFLSTHKHYEMVVPDTRLGYFAILTRT